MVHVAKQINQDCAYVHFMSSEFACSFYTSNTDGLRINDLLISVKPAKDKNGNDVQYKTIRTIDTMFPRLSSSSGSGFNNDANPAEANDAYPVAPWKRYFKDGLLSLEDCIANKRRRLEDLEASVVQAKAELAVLTETLDFAKKCTR